MKKLYKDIGRFSIGSVIVGASAKAVVPFGSPYGQGISTVGAMMPVIGSTMMMGHMVRLSSKMMPNNLPGMKTNRRRKW